MIQLRPWAIAWCHRYDGGRSWYTALGHLDEYYGDERFRQHLLGGIIYAAAGLEAFSRKEGIDPPE